MNPTPLRAALLPVATLALACGGSSGVDTEDRAPAQSGIDAPGSLEARSRNAESDWRYREYGIGVVTYPVQETDALEGVVWTAPRASADTLATFGNGKICFRPRGECVSLYERTLEYGYEISGWAILGFDADTSWARISVDPFDDSVSEAWVSLEPPGIEPILWTQELLGHPLFFLWPDSIRFFSLPSTEHPESIELVPFSEPERFDYVLRPLEAKGHWLRVEVLTPGIGCGMPDLNGAKADTVWIRYIDDSGRPRTFYFTRGC